MNHQFNVTPVIYCLISHQNIPFGHASFVGFLFLWRSIDTKRGRKGGYLLEWKYENNLPHTPIGLESWKPNLPFLIPIAGSSSLLFLLNWLGDTASRCTETKSLSREFRQKRVLEDFAKDEEDEISEIRVESQSKWYADDYERDRIFAALAKYLLKIETKLYLHIISE